MSLELAALLFVGGALSAAINTVAGGGSLLSLPLLMFAGGLPATVANGTNRVGVLLQTLTATARYGRAGLWAGAVDMREIVASALGAAVGASLSLQLDERAMRVVIAVMLVIVLLTMWLVPDPQEGTEHAPAPLVPRLLTYAVVGAYGGFLHAGVSLALLAAGVGLSGRTLRDANVAKVLIALVFTLPALGVFALDGQVDWGQGVVFAAGSAAGAWAGARWAVSWSPRLLRGLIVVVVLLSAAKLLWG